MICIYIYNIYACIYIYNMNNSISLTIFHWECRQRADWSGGSGVARIQEGTPTHRRAHQEHLGVVQPLFVLEAFASSRGGNWCRNWTRSSVKMLSCISLAILLKIVWVVWSDVEVEEQQKNSSNRRLPSVHHGRWIAAVPEHRHGQVGDHEDKLEDLNLETPEKIEIDFSEYFIPDLLSRIFVCIHWDYCRIVNIYTIIHRKTCWEILFFE